MTDYEFSININNTAESITPRKGFPFSLLGVLLHDLYPAINPTGSELCSLYRIDNHGYTPHFVTESEICYNSFIEVHRNIQTRSLADLNKKEQRYATTLKKVLSNHRYLEPRDMHNNVIARIDPALIERTVSSYNVVTTVEGVISQMGSRTLQQGTHIYLAGVDYKIYTSHAQDEVLRDFYKGVKISLNVKQKRSLTDDRIINATLLSFSPHSHLGLIDKVQELSKADRLFKTL